MNENIRVATTDFNDLKKALSQKNYRAVTTILDKKPWLLNHYRTPTYESPLAHVLNKKPIDYRMLEILTDHHVTFNYPINHHKELPIELACKNRDLQLYQFLIRHGATVSSRAPHFLLVHSTEIKYITEDNLKNVCGIIKLMGGLEEVSAKVDSEEQSFKDQAMNLQLINQSGGIIKYDYMRLLEAAYALADAKDGASTQIRLLKNLIEEIKSKYTAKECYDRENLKDSIRLFYMTGSELVPLKKIPAPSRTEVIHESKVDSPTRSDYPSI